MDTETKTMEPPVTKDNVDDQSDLPKGHENGIKSDSPSDDLIDSIEEGLVKTEDNIVEIETVLGDTIGETNETRAKNDLKTSNEIQINGKLSDIPIGNEQNQNEIGENDVLNEKKEYKVESNKQENIGNEQKQTDFGEHVVLDEDKDIKVETTKQGNVEIINNETKSEPTIASVSKESNMINSVSIESSTKERSTEELLGATGGSEIPAEIPAQTKVVDDNDDDDFKAMTEDEIQAIIKKYSFMDPEVRNRSLRFFWSLDVDRWGYFNVTHLRYWYRAQGSILTDKQIARIFVDLDKDRDSLVSLDEFLDEMSKKRPRLLRQDELREMFESWDINKDGFVCEDDIRNKMEKMNRVTNSFYIYQVLEYDRKGEGRLDYIDFCRFAQDTMLERMPMRQF